MAIISKTALHVAAHPFAFVLQTLRGFRKNQGMLLAGAIAYYALLSIVPVLILSVIVLALRRSGGLADPARAVAGLAGPEPGRRSARRRSRFLANRVAIGSVLITLMAFSSAAFRHREGVSVISCSTKPERNATFRFRAPSLRFASCSSCGSRCCA